VRTPALLATVLLEVRSKPAPTNPPLVAEACSFEFCVQKLLQSELDGDCQMHGYRLAIEQCGPILPLAKRFHSRLM
jgi:hypothetical protein